jgi:arginine/ornithine N-succinyltransferase beta subunit
VRESLRLPARLVDWVDAPPRIVSDDRIASFRAVRVPVVMEPEAAVLPREAGAALRVSDGEFVRVRP